MIFIYSLINIVIIRELTENPGKKIIFNGNFSKSMKFPKLILASDKSRKVKDWVSSL